MRRWIAFAVVPSACIVALACSSSSDGGDVHPEADAAPETSGPALDAKAEAAVDADTPDGARPKALDVRCKGDPCYVAVSGNGGHHMCGLLRDGAVRCWGRDSLRPLEPGTTGDRALGRGADVSAVDGATAAPVVGLSSVAQVSVGPNLGTCARTTDGAVYCWGRNEDGQLGRPPSEATLLTPTRVEGLPSVRDVQLGQKLACAIATDGGALYCWGTFSESYEFDWSAHGVDASASTAFAPQVVGTMRAPLTSLAIGTAGFPPRDTVIAVREDQTLVNIGAHITGETSVNPPWQAPLEHPSVRAAWTFAYLESDGLLWQWLPLFGRSTTTKAYVPVSDQIVDVKMSAYNSGPPSETPEIVQGGALLSTGRLFRWGTNSAGGLGVHPSTKPKAEFPMEVTQLGRQVVSFATTLASACASLVDGSVECWGGNANGELGRGTVDLAPHPDAEVIR